MVALSLQSEIIEIDHFEEIYPQIHTDTLIVLDIDNTLIEPCQTLGSDQWFYSQLHHYVLMGFDTTNALEKALSEWMSIQNVTKVKPVEENIPKIIRDLQSRNYRVIALTTRGLELSTRTIEQLKSVGIDLSITAPTKEDLFFMNGRGVLFRNGVLFTAATNKATALFKLLHETKVDPKSIIYVNDKRSHFYPVEEFANHHQIPFIGLRYGFLDEKIRSLDRTLTDVQLKHFGKILSDDEAKEIMKNQNTPGTIR